MTNEIQGVDVEAPASSLAPKAQLQELASTEEFSGSKVQRECELRELTVARATNAFVALVAAAVVVLLVMGNHIARAQPLGSA
jgi:hypothetical protein